MLKLRSHERRTLIMRADVEPAGKLHIGRDAVDDCPHP